MISLRRISGQIRIGIVRSNNLHSAAWLCDPVQLCDKPQHVRNMFDHVTTNDLFELIVAERIRKGSEIVNDVSMAQRIRIDADRAGEFVLTTANIKHFLFY